MWHAITALPTYLTSDDGSVQITERALGRVFSADAIYVILGLLVEAGWAATAWQFFRRLGWLVAVMALTLGLSAGTVCWLIGLMQGPRNLRREWRLRCPVKRCRLISPCTPHRPSSSGPWARSSR